MPGIPLDPGLPPNPPRFDHRVPRFSPCTFAFTHVLPAHPDDLRSNNNDTDENDPFDPFRYTCLSFQSCLGIHQRHCHHLRTRDKHVVMCKCNDRVRTFANFAWHARATILTLTTLVRR